MAASRRNIAKLINAAVREQPVHKLFLTDLMVAIERKDQLQQRKPSKWYKPSAFVCMRQMYFMRTEAETDNSRSEYNGIGMADTGSRRHEAIQEALLQIKDLGFDWEYMDVEDYLKMKWAEGKCLNLEVKGKRGVETRLFDKVLKVSFMCDGIIKRISTGRYYLFEFKNQISFKYASKVDGHIDEEHTHQVTIYCTELDLDAALVVYENRDTCELNCPELFIVTEEMKQGPIDKILECEGYVERLIPPPKYETTKPCRWCSYKTACQKAGN